MKIQDQVYFAIQARLERICRGEYAAHKAKYKKKIPPITYSSEVSHLIKLSSYVLEASDSEAEEIMAEITSGEIQYKFLKGNS